MTISIWIIIILLCFIGLILYYKKNKANLIDHKETVKNKNYSLTNFDQLLKNLTNNQDIKEEEPIENMKTEEIEKINENDKELKEKNSINLKESVLGSLILERKKKKK